MSITHKSYLEELPSELIHRIFDYLDTETIIFSIRCVNKRFYSVSNDYNRYELDFRYMSKTDLRLIARMIDPKHIISITLADELQTSGQIQLFLSLFPVDQFIRLRSLNLINVETEEFQAFEKHLMRYPLKSCFISPGSYKKYYNRKHFDLTLLSSIISHNSLRKFEFDGEYKLHNEILWPVQCRLQHVTLSLSKWDGIYDILHHVPNLQTLVVKFVHIRRYWVTTIDKDFEIQPSNHLNLTSLSINDWEDLKMDKTESLLSLLPMLKNLQLFFSQPSVDRQFFDGSYWEEFIQMKLPVLNAFQFWFSNSRDFDSNSVTVESLIAPFQTPFWLENKNWCVKCDYEHGKYRSIFHIYSIPTFRKSLAYPSTQNEISYSALNTTDNNTTVVINTHELCVDIDKISLNTYSIANHLFPNVTELQLRINQTWSIDSIEQLSNIVYLCGLQKLELNFRSTCQIDNIDVTLEILFKHAFNLRSIKIYDGSWGDSRPILNNIFLKIPRHIKCLDTSIRNLDDVKMILDNVEHLSSFKYETFKSFYLDGVEKEIKEWFLQKRRDVTIQKELENCGSCGSRCGQYQRTFPIHMWLGKNMSKESNASVSHKRIKITHSDN